MIKKFTIVINLDNARSPATPMLQTLNPKVQSRLGLSTQDIATFCQHWGIESMALFGSILREETFSN